MTDTYDEQFQIYLRFKEDGRMKDCDQDLELSASPHLYGDDDDVPPSFDLNVGGYIGRRDLNGEVRVFVDNHDDVTTLREQFTAMLDALDKHVDDYEKRRQGKPDKGDDDADKCVEAPPVSD